MSKTNKTPKPQYPFRSKKSIIAQLETDPAFVLQCLQILNARQTSDEAETLTTKYRNRRGWMSSHAVNGGKLAVKAETEGLTAEELDKARGMVSRYGKQLALHFRREQISVNPELAAVAEMFSAN